MDSISRDLHICPLLLCPGGTEREPSWLGLAGLGTVYIPEPALVGVSSTHASWLENKEGPSQEYKSEKPGLVGWLSGLERPTTLPRVVGSGPSNHMVAYGHP